VEVVPLIAGPTGVHGTPDCDMTYTRVLSMIGLIEPSGFSWPARVSVAEASEIVIGLPGSQSALPVEQLWNAVSHDTEGCGEGGGTCSEMPVSGLVVAFVIGPM